MKCIMKAVVVIGLLAVFAVPSRLMAEPLESKFEETRDKGLKWLAKQQFPDGHWEANAGQFGSGMTALAGMCYLMEGSTMRTGKYSKQIQNAVEWLMKQVQPSGLIGDPNAPNQGLGYMYGHGFSLMFLSQIYGEEDDEQRRSQLEKILPKAVVYCGNAQTFRGGWGYLSAKDMASNFGKDFDEGSVTVTQVQALRAARNAGIAVPKSIIDNTHDYLKKCTTTKGGMIYSLSSANGVAQAGQERPTITCAAIATLFSTGEYTNPLAKQWLKFCQPVIPIDRVGTEQFGHSEYTHYYYAQVIYMLGDNGYAKMFPDSKPEERLTWTKYRSAFFEFLRKTQLEDGHWNGAGVGSVYTACCYLTVLQLDNAALPIYQR